MPELNDVSSRTKTPRFGIVIPENRLLTFTVFWIALMAIGKIAQFFQSAPEDLFEEAGNEIAGQFHPYYGGAIYSGIPPVSFVALIAAATFVACVLVPRFQSPSVAKRALATLFFLSLFTLWIESLFTVSGIVTTGLLKLVKLSTFIPDLIVSAIWLTVWRKAVANIDLELESNLKAETIQAGQIWFEEAPEPALSTDLSATANPPSFETITSTETDALEPSEASARGLSFSRIVAYLFGIWFVLRIIQRLLE